METGKTVNNVNGKVPEAPKKDINIRLPEVFFMLSEDGEYNGRETEGRIGIKYGEGKTDWVWLSYMSFKKMIDLCKDNRDVFNSQLKKEIAKAQVEAL